MNKEEESGFYKVKLNADGKIIMIVGTSGSGKSVLLQNYVYNFKRFQHGKVIYLTEKPQSPMENAFCCIDKLSTFQKNEIEKSMIPQHEIHPENVEIYHPFTFNFPTTRVPEIINFCTFDIKSVDKDSFSAMLGRDTDSSSVLLCSNIAKHLEATDSLFTFLFKAYKMTSEKDDDIEIRKVQQLSEENLWVPFETYGSKKDIDQLKVTSKELLDDYFLQPINCIYNLTPQKMKEIIQDNSKITLFTTWKIRDKKTKYFFYIELLKRLNKAIIENKHPPILIVLEEIKILLPKTLGDKEEFKHKLSELLRETLSGMRSSNVTICLDENTKIQTKYGDIKIKDIKDDTDVKSYNLNTNRIEYKKAKKYFSGYQDVFELSLINGEKVIATDTHKFFVNNNNIIVEKMLKDITLDDEILVDDVTKYKICKCGCGERVRLRHNIYIHGHNSTGHRHSEKTKRIISQKNTGKIRTDEYKLKMSQIKKVYRCSEKTKQKLRINAKNNPNYGTSGKKFYC